VAEGGEKGSGGVSSHHRKEGKGGYRPYYYLIGLDWERGGKNKCSEWRSLFGSAQIMEETAKKL